MANCIIENCPRVYGELSDAQTILQLKLSVERVHRALVRHKMCLFHFKGIHLRQMRHYTDNQDRQYVDEDNEPDPRERIDFRYKPKFRPSVWLGTVVYNVPRTNRIMNLVNPTRAEFVNAIKLEKINNEFINKSNCSRWVLNKAPCFNNRQITLNARNRILVIKRVNNWHL